MKDDEFINLKLHFRTEGICQDCEKDIEEPYWTNLKGEIVHVTTLTFGHYYNDGTARCDGCHDANR